MTRRNAVVAVVLLLAVASPYAGFIPGWSPGLATNVALTALHIGADLYLRSIEKMRRTIPGGPIAANRTLLRTRWLVHRDAIEGVDYDLDRLTSVWVATNDQDSSLVERAHLGVSSPAYLPGPYSPFTEGLVDKFSVWYLNRLAAGLK